MIVWLAMFRVFVFDSAAYATITMYFFRKQVQLGSIRYYYNVLFPYRRVRKRGNTNNVEFLPRNI